MSPCQLTPTATFVRPQSSWLAPHRATNHGYKAVYQDSQEQADRQRVAGTAGKDRTVHHPADLTPSLSLSLSQLQLSPRVEPENHHAMITSHHLPLPQPHCPSEPPARAVKRPPTDAEWADQQASRLQRSTQLDSQSSCPSQPRP